MGDIIPFPIQEKLHWNGRYLTYQELRYVREYLLSVSRRIRIKRLSFSGIDFRGNDVKVIIDQLYEKKIIGPEERNRIYNKINV
ncbi:hypothetical protein [Ammoniphilus sp. CFH 90114]|uniref:hypothetical protein n=1 Tax=Ammoniphilus sp. CFH 90114 TaxID=2493665 RepID=UPI00100EFEAF|nr:hypothetical protein [Ammoniphilus sp. CFH 90114]RXT03626.1 hypothetical protein EIZ39_23660 [Ammoniphilus sp. CFH 90114]